MRYSRLLGVAAMVAACMVTAAEASSIPVNDAPIVMSVDIAPDALVPLGLDFVAVTEQADMVAPLASFKPTDYLAPNTEAAVALAAAWRPCTGTAPRPNADLHAGLSASKYTEPTLAVDPDPIV